MPLDERLHVRRRDETDRMAELGDLTPPVVGARTRLHGHRTGRQRGQERQKLAAAQLLAKDHRARAVSPMELKDVLGEIEADRANLVHGRLLEWALTPPLWHAEAVGGRSHHHARLVHTRSRAARQRPMQGGALHHRAFCVNFWIESLPGTIVVKTAERRLYLVLGDGTAIRYAVAVGKPGKQWQGQAQVS